MSGKIVIITPNGEKTEEPYTGDEPELETLQKHVGGWIEQVPCAIRYADLLCVAYVNEEGILQDLPYNDHASRLARHNYRLRGNIVIVVPARENDG